MFRASPSSNVATSLRPVSASDLRVAVTVEGSISVVTSVPSLSRAFHRERGHAAFIARACVHAAVHEAAFMQPELLQDELLVDELTALIAPYLRLDRANRRRA